MTMVHSTLRTKNECPQTERDRQTEKEEEIDNDIEESQHTHRHESMEKEREREKKIQRVKIHWNRDGRSLLANENVTSGSYFLKNT